VAMQPMCTDESSSTSLLVNDLAQKRAARFDLQPGQLTIGSNTVHVCTKVCSQTDQPSRDFECRRLFHWAS